MMVGQNHSPLVFGCQFSVVYQVGTHQKSIGMRINAFCQANFFQVNSSSSLTFFPKSYGGRRNLIQNKNELGAVCFFGSKNQFVSNQLTVLTHQSLHDYSISFASIWYNDNARTSQRSGAFGIQVKKISLNLENDAFAGIATDRFRTGFFQVKYKDSLFNIGSGIYIWTGETSGVSAKRIPNSIDKKYKDISTLPYGRTSHGIWYIEGEMRVANAQLFQMKVGLDSEEIRNTVQNRFLHDLPFLPTKYQKQTPHYPRLNKDGLPVFTAKEAKKIRHYFSVGFNEY
jgi:hypothetical protein